MESGTASRDRPYEGVRSLSAPPPISSLPRREEGRGVGDSSMDVEGDATGGEQPEPLGVVQQQADAAV
jgi:hypothetical protein